MGCSRHLKLAMAMTSLVGCGRIGFDSIDGIGEGSANYVFVTSTTVMGGAIGGLAGADEICNARAVAKQLPGTYVAWLSTSTVNARDRLGTARGWIRTDGRAVTDRIEDLTAGVIFHPIAVDEAGRAVNARALTGTSPDGMPTMSASFTTCVDYTVVSSANVLTGTTTAGGGGFTSHFTGNCSSVLRLYCFGIDRQDAVAPARVSGRVAFVSSALWTPAGIADADALCQSEATAASLPGSYRAFIATSTASAASRFDGGGAPWVRVDGVPLATTAAQVLAGSTSAGLNQHADGTYAVYKAVWFGATSPSVVGDMTCADWTSQVEMTRKGYAYLTGSEAFDGFMHPCATLNAHVYCLQE